MTIDAGDALWRIRGDASELDAALQEASSNVVSATGEDAEYKIGGDTSELDSAVEAASESVETATSDEAVVHIDGDSSGVEDAAQAASDAAEQATAVPAEQEFTGDTSDLDEALDEAAAHAEETAERIKYTAGDITNSLSTIGKSMTVAGGAIVGTLGAMVFGWASAGDEIQKTAIRTGVGTEALSEYKYILEQNGASLGDFERANKNMTKVLYDAAQGTGNGADAIARLGLSIDQVMAMSPEQRFRTLTAAIGEMSNYNDQAAIAMELFGSRVGTSLLPMIEAGAADFERLRLEAHELGIVFDQEGADSAARFGDMMDTLKQSFRGVMIEMGPVIADIIENYVPGMIKAVEGAIKWIDQNQELVKTFTVVAAAVGAFMVTMGPFLVMLPGLIALFKAVAVVVGVFAGVLSGPIILAIAAVVAAGVLLYAFWDEIKAGAEALWKGLQSAFEAGSSAVVAVWDWMVGVGSAAWGALTGGFTAMADVITGVFTGVAGFFRGIWNGIVSIFQGAWEIIRTIINAVIGGVNSVMSAASMLPGVPQLQLPMLAEGGAAREGQPYIVGERGRELFIPSESGRVENASNTGAGGVTLNVNINGSVNANSEQDVRRLSEEIAAAAVRELRAAGVTA